MKKKKTQTCEADANGTVEPASLVSALSEKKREGKSQFNLAG